MLNKISLLIFSAISVTNSQSVLAAASSEMPMVSPENPSQDIPTSLVLSNQSGVMVDVPELSKEVTGFSKIRISAQFMDNVSLYSDSVKIYDNITGAFVGSTDSRTESGGRYVINSAYPIKTDANYLQFCFVVHDVLQGQYYGGICSSLRCKSGKIPLSYIDKKTKTLMFLEAIRFNILKDRIDESIYRSPIVVQLFTKYGLKSSSPIFNIVNMDLAKPGTFLNDDEVITGILKQQPKGFYDARQRPSYDCEIAKINTSGGEIIIETSSSQDSSDDSQTIETRFYHIGEYLKLARQKYPETPVTLTQENIKLLLNFFIKHSLIWKRDVKSVREFFGWEKK